jgi:hypothetical protein
MSKEEFMEVFSNSDDKRLFRFYYDGSMMELYLSGDKEALVIRSGMRDTDIRDMIVLAYNKGLENGLKGCQGAS